MVKIIYREPVFFCHNATCKIWILLLPCISDLGFQKSRKKSRHVNWDFFSFNGTFLEVKSFFSREIPLETIRTKRNSIMIFVILHIMTLCVSLQFSKDMNFCASARSRYKWGREHTFSDFFILSHVVQLCVWWYTKSPNDWFI